MRRSTLDVATRERLRRWLAYILEEYRHQYPDAKALARKLGATGPAITMILSGQRSMGLDMLLKIHRELCKSIDTLVDTDPPAASKRPFCGSSAGSRQQSA